MNLKSAKVARNRFSQICKRHGWYKNSQAGSRASQARERQPKGSATGTDRGGKAAGGNRGGRAGGGGRSGGAGVKEVFHPGNFNYKGGIGGRSGNSGNAADYYAAQDGFAPQTKSAKEKAEGEMAGQQGPSKVSSAGADGKTNAPQADGWLKKESDPGVVMNGSAQGWDGAKWHMGREAARREGLGVVERFENGQIKLEIQDDE